MDIDRLKDLIDNLINWIIEMSTETDADIKQLISIIKLMKIMGIILDHWIIRTYLAIENRKTPDHLAPLLLH